MTRVWSEGFELQDLIGYTYSGVSIQTGIKRSGAASIRTTKTSTYFQKSITAISEFYLRFGMYIDTYSTLGRMEIKWFSGATVLGTLFVSHSGVLSVEVGAGYGAVATGSTTLGLDSWYLIELHVKIDDSTGSIDVKVDGNSDIAYSGDTKPGFPRTGESLSSLTKIARTA